jgi:aminoglycoside 6'-N-acetyltransferase
VIAARRRILTGTRVSLREVGECDAALLARILTEDAVARWWPGYTIERVREELVAPSPEKLVFAIETRGETVGAIQAYFEFDPSYRHAGMDLFVASTWQRRGIGSDAIRTLARYIFEELGHHRIVIDPALENTAAIRAYEGLGFTRVGVMRKYERRSDGTWHDGVLLELLRGELTG